MLAACAPDETDDQAQTDEAAGEEPGDLGELEGELDPEDLEGELDLDDLMGDQGDMPDPSENVEDGVFRGDGILLPIPDGFELEPTAYMQGLVAAITSDGEQQIAGQAVDSASVEEPLDLDELAEANQEQFGEADLDEETEIEGSTRARQLRFDEVPAQQPEGSDLTVVLVLAEDDEGHIAIFNYVAPVDDFDEGEADAVLAGIGFDPDSSPPEPEPMPAP